MSEWQMERVTSTRIREVGWKADEEEGEVGAMRVVFIRGDVYEFAGVSQEDYRIFKNAPSPGQSFASFIVPRYGKGRRL